MGLAMSELPSEAAIPDCVQHVSFVPKSDIRIPSSDCVKAAAETLVGDSHHRRRVLWER
jgi:hypothetical protein